MSDIKERLLKLDGEVTKYTSNYPSRLGKGRVMLLRTIEDGMKSLLKDIKEKEDGEEYNKLIGRLNDWYSDPLFNTVYGMKKRKPRIPDVPKYEIPKEPKEEKEAKEAKEAKEELEEMEIDKLPSEKDERKVTMSMERPELISDTPMTSTFTPEPETPMPETPMPETPMGEDITDDLLDLDTPTGEEMAEEEMKEEEMKEEEKREEMKEEERDEEEEMKEEEMDFDPEMEKFHNQIRKEEREKVMREFNLVDPTIGTIDIPKERLGIEGKTIKILNDDIRYFIKRFPDILKMEATVYKKTNKKNKKALQDLHRRIQAKLSPDPKKEDEGGKVGIILDADKFIDMKITELLAAKTLEGLTPANLVDITEEPKSQGRDVGSYTLTRRGGRDIINNAPVYRAIPSTQPKQPKRRGEISQSTIYKNSGKTKVDIAKMEMRDNPFIRESKPQRLNIIL